MIDINEETIDKIIKYYYSDKLNREKVKQYINKCKDNRDKQGRYEYEKQEGYKNVEIFIDILSYDEFNSPEWNGEYQGGHLHCGDCEYHKYTMEFAKNKNDSNSIIIYHSNCKMIDHNKIKLYKSCFKSYDCGQHSCDICYYYKSASWNLSGQKEWKGINAYIKFMDKEWHNPSRYEIINNVSKLDYKIRNTLVYNGNEYVVSLRSWLDGTAVKDNRINYIYWYEINETKRKNNRILHNEVGSIEIK